MVLAEWWERLVGRFIDGILFCVVYFILGAIVGAIFVSQIVVQPEHRRVHRRRPVRARRGAAPADRRPPVCGLRRLHARPRRPDARQEGHEDPHRHGRTGARPDQATLMKRAAIYPGIIAIAGLLGFISIFGGLLICVAHRHLHAGGRHLRAHRLGAAAGAARQVVVGTIVVKAQQLERPLRAGRGQRIRPARAMRGASTGRPRLRLREHPAVPRAAALPRGRRTPYAYNPYATPYGTPYPARARPGAGAAARLMVVAPVLMMLAALPFLLFGALFRGRARRGQLAPEVLASPSMQRRVPPRTLVVVGRADASAGSSSASRCSTSSSASSPSRVATGPGSSPPSSPAASRSLLVAGLVVSGGRDRHDHARERAARPDLGSGCDPVQPGCERLVRGTSVSFARLGVWTPSRPSSSRAPAPSSPAG